MKMILISLVSVYQARWGETDCDFACVCYQARWGEVASDFACVCYQARWGETDRDFACVCYQARSGEVAVNFACVCYQVGWKKCCGFRLCLLSSEMGINLPACFGE